jgi:hypothetical protein
VVLGDFAEAKTGVNNAPHTTAPATNRHLFWNLRVI